MNAPICRHFNDRAVYTCDDGYQIVGLEQVICNSDGAWSGSQPSCKQASSNAQSRYYCGEPTHIPNAKHNGSSEQVSETVTERMKGARNEWHSVPLVAPVVVGWTNQLQYCRRALYASQKNPRPKCAEKQCFGSQSKWAS